MPASVIRRANNVSTPPKMNPLLFGFCTIEIFMTSEGPMRALISTLLNAAAQDDRDSVANNMSPVALTFQTRKETI
jgi:hypothetical protein